MISISIRTDFRNGNEDLIVNYKDVENKNKSRNIWRLFGLLNAWDHTCIKRALFDTNNPDFFKPMTVFSL